MSSVSSSNASITDLFRPKKPKGLTQKNLSFTRLYLLRREIETNLHLLPLNELFEKLQTDPLNGLSNERAKALLEHDGPNALTPSSQYGWPIVLFKSLCTGFSLLIWLGALLCIISYVIESSTKPNPSTDNFYLGCVLIFVDIVCGLFSFYQNYTSTKIMKTFNRMIPTYTTCIREGVAHNETPVRDLVKGDIVRVTAGDIIPADIRIIDSKGFKVDNSSLTGECIAVSRCNTDGISNILESQNVAFFSTQCVEGWALGVVLCCGDVTALGRVAGLAARLEPGPSPLARELRRFMTFMSAWAFGLGIFIATAALVLGYPFMETSIFVIGIIVANIPEELKRIKTRLLSTGARTVGFVDYTCYKESDLIKDDEDSSFYDRVTNCLAKSAPLKKC